MQDEGDTDPPAKRRRLLDADASGDDAGGELDGIYNQDFYKPTGFGEMGLYLRNKRKKLAVQRQQFLDHEPEHHPPVFDKVAVYINGLTKTPLATLSRLLTIYGGEYVPYLDKKGLITHIVAAELTPTKRKEFARYKVVTEDWITESVAAGKLLDWRQFKLYGASTGPRDTDTDSVGGMPSAQLSLLNHVSANASDSSPLKAVESPNKRTEVPKRSPVKDTGPSSEWESYLPKAKNHRRSALLDDEEWRQRHTAVAGMDYIEGYYKTSRLHHLSTWKASLSGMVERLKSELVADGHAVRVKMVDAKPSKPLKGTTEDQRTIFHVDFDSFFVAVGLASRPHLRGKPVAVCHAKGGDDAGSSTSEIASCSYEARACGVKNGISLGRARELCPDIQAMPYEFDLYAQHSESMYKILLMRGDALEAVSVDEAYIDVSPQVSTPDDALQMAEHLRTDIRNATGCEVSIGISYNVVLARLATKRAKPASAYYLRESEALSFLSPLPVDELPGIGWSMRDKLNNVLGVHTLADALEAGKTRLQQAIGPLYGERVYNFARGIDPRMLKAPTVRNSFSTELNYGIRFKAEAEVEDFMRNLSGYLSKQMEKSGYRGRHLALKVMRRAADAAKETPKFLGHGACDIFTRYTELGVATNDAGLLTTHAVRLMKEMRIPADELRGIALNMTQLDTGESSSQRRLTFGPRNGAEGSIENVELRDPSKDLPSAAIASRGATTLAHASHPHPAAPVFASAPAKGQLALPRVKVNKKNSKAVQSTLNAKMGLKDPRRRPIVPTNPSKAELHDMGIDPDYWLSLPRWLQLETWQGAWYRLEEQGALRAKEEAAAEAIAIAAAVAPMLKPFHLDFAPMPSFAKSTNLDAICDILAQWVENVGLDDEPLDRDVDKFRRFLVAKADRRQPAGQDVAFVGTLLSWWKTLIRSASHASWDAAWDRCRRAVDEVTGLAPMVV